MDETGKDANNEEEEETGGGRKSSEGTRTRTTSSRIMKKDDRSNDAVATSLAHQVFNSDDCKRFIGSDLPGGRAFISKDAFYSSRNSSSSNEFVMDWKNKNYDDHQDGYVLRRRKVVQDEFSSRFATRRVEKDALHPPTNRTNKSPLNVLAKVQKEPEKRKTPPFMVPQGSVEPPKKERRVVAPPSTGNSALPKILTRMTTDEDKPVLKEEKNGADDAATPSPAACSQPMTTTTSTEKHKVVKISSSPQERAQQLSSPTTKPPPPPPPPPTVSNKSGNKEDHQGTLPRDDSNAPHRRWSLE